MEQLQRCSTGRHWDSLVVAQAEAIQAAAVEQRAAVSQRRTRFLMRRAGCPISSASALPRAYAKKEKPRDLSVSVSREKHLPTVFHRKLKERAFLPCQTALLSSIF